MSRVTDPVVFGAAYSVYVRIVRLALTEKQVGYRLEEIDIFAPSARLDHRLRHPFGRIPTFEHDGFHLYETTAIVRYIDEAFPGVPLQPTNPRARARVNQITAILDSYAYRPLVWGIYMERVDAARSGRTPDETAIAAAIPEARRCLVELADLMGTAPFLGGDALSLADLHAAPMFAYFLAAAEGKALMAEQPALHAWWLRMAERPAMTITRPSPNPVA
jgi:glutathione S-transferase